MGSHRGLTSKGGGYSFKIDLNAANKSMVNPQTEGKSLEEQYQDEEEEYFMKEDPTTWDVFKDA
jgi:hypothetical protein